MNGFPYFQFHADKWLTGKISAFDLEEQGFFLNLCLLAWASQGQFSICSTTVQRRYRKSQEWISETIAAFVDVGVIEDDGEKYRIKFIDEQINMLSGKRQQKIDAGKASAEARRASSKSKEDSKQDESKQEKSSTFNERPTLVEQTFNAFWSAWPSSKRKLDKAKCFSAWKNRNLYKLADEIMKGLECWKSSRDWLKDGGQFIPMPITWLNNTRWDDTALAALSVKSRPSGKPSLNVIENNRERMMAQ